MTTCCVPFGKPAVYPIMDIAFYPVVLHFLSKRWSGALSNVLWKSKISNLQKDYDPVLGWISSILLWSNCVSHEWLGLNPYCLSVRTRWIIWDIIGVTNTSLCYPTTRVGQVLLFEDVALGVEGVLWSPVML